MMRFSREVCDGRIDARRCVPCWLEWRGVPEALAIPAGELLRRVARGAPHAPGRLGTVLRAPARIDAAARRLDELADLADRVIAVSAWLRDALLRNGVPQDKLVLCRQGVAALQPPEAWGPIAKARSGAPLRIGFFGRGTKVKGVDRLVRAVRSLPRACAVELRVHALANLAEDRAFMAAVRAQADGEPRIQFAEPVPQADVQSAMRQYDVVAVPSMWLETGPLVAMEALAAGIPVLGSDLGGLRELIEPGVTGWLVPAYDVAAWSRQIAALAEPHAAPMRWERERTPIITMDTVAERMLGLYRELVA
jgi:glycosyltransferase involved in cell wall biosynthesis